MSSSARRPGHVTALERSPALEPLSSSPSALMLAGIARQRRCQEKLGPCMIELLLRRGSSPCSVVHTTEPTAVPHTANVATHDKRCAMEDRLFFAAPFYTVPLGIKRSVRNQAPNGTSCISPEPSTIGPDLPSPYPNPGTRMARIQVDVQLWPWLPNEPANHPSLRPL